ncbi:sterol desaturase family protein [Zoogloea sp.]|uniref:sterol desaturase family protein n=1 Tax=Zoogloea sp. TaxID=49181 RepID=UPI002C42FBC4|nr:sterol desaturase family protein [Zoogloea sp.]HOY01742.1 sterol desaturase family protein [Zoogloea sp.]HPI59560.1 sterol desaturase family protein [Zoogloea sp.]
MPPLQEVIPQHWRPWVLALGLGLLLVAVAEGLVRERYDWRGAAASLADAAGRRLLEALGISMLAPAVAWAHQHRLGDIPLDAPLPWAALFIAQELAYYWGHRLSHRVHWFWASHAVHHSPPQLSLMNALRLGWTGKLAGNALFVVPLVWIGFAPAAVALMMGLNLLYQFGLHAPWLPRLGPLEWVFNTPRHHRVHHACNPEYLDCNYGGVLIVFDRLFGSLRLEQPDIPPRYGLSEPLHSHNPLLINLHGWQRLWRDLRAAHGMRQRWRVLTGPPGQQGADTPARPVSPHTLFTATRSAGCTSPSSTGRGPCRPAG